MLALGAVVLIATACGSDGRALRAPSADQTTTTASTVPTTTAPDASAGEGEGTTPPEPMRLTSPALAEGGEVPVDFTCRGADVSPPLGWTPAPAGTVELAVVVRDVDAGGFVHWVVAGLPPTLDGLAEGAVPAEAVEAANDFGRPGWAGPCPPSGTHHYEIRVYALTQPSGVTAGQPGADAAAAVEATPALMSAVLSASASAG